MAAPTRSLSAPAARAVLVLSLASAGMPLALAQTAPAPAPAPAAAPAPPLPPAAMSTAAEFAAIDTNYDGRISSSEHEVYARKLFDEMDEDPDDDKLTRAEIMRNESKFVRHVFTTGNILGPADLTTKEKIQRLDANQDGVISQTEHANAAAAKFQKMDINNNGELSPEEFDAGG